MPDPNATTTTWLDLFNAGGFMMYLMLGVSVMVLFIAFERVLAVWSARRQIHRVDEKVVEAARKGNLEEARRLCDGVSASWRNVFSSGLDRALGRVKGEPGMAMSRELKRSVGRLRSAIWILGSAGALMPFVGLLGTVLGVMSSFQAIGSAGTGGFAVVSAGISEALIATAAGLFVALEAVVCFNLLQNSMAGVARDMGLLVDELNEILQTRRADASSTDRV